jgi:hypothetical protein
VSDVAPKAPKVAKVKAVKAPKVEKVKAEKAPKVAKVKAEKEPRASEINNLPKMTQVFYPKARQKT